MLCNDLTLPEKCQSITFGQQLERLRATRSESRNCGNSLSSEKLGMLSRTPSAFNKWARVKVFSLQSTTKQIMQNNQSQSCTMKSPRWRSRGAYRTSRCCPQEEGEEPQHCSVDCSPAASAVSDFPDIPACVAVRRTPWSRNRERSRERCDLRDREVWRWHHSE